MTPSFGATRRAAASALRECRGAQMAAHIPLSGSVAEVEYLERVDCVARRTRLARRQAQELPSDARNACNVCIFDISGED